MTTNPGRILIWDNGASYEDHHVGFIEIGENDVDLVELDLRRRDPSQKGYVIAVVESVSWRLPCVLTRWEPVKPTDTSCPACGKVHAEVAT